MAVEHARQLKPLERGDPVKILDGDFANFTGVVEEVNNEQGTLKVMVTIFGRQTPIELGRHEVEVI